MKTIWKYPIECTDEQTVDLPKGAKILSVQVQGYTPTLWALVDPKEGLEKVSVRVFGTGHPIDFYPGDFVGTYQLLGGQLVFHVFVEVRP